MKPWLFGISFSLLFGCSESPKIQISHDLEQISDSIAKQGLEVLPTLYRPAGLSDTLVLGTTFPVEKDTTSKFSSLHIEGIQCTWNLRRGKMAKYYFLFHVPDSAEQNRLEQFSTYLLLYLSSDNRQVHMYRRSPSIWLLEYYPFDPHPKSR
ncbi:MAG: hypothetical protein EP332_08980 [Bacteroidetes bacterium]|nr:MAG: hypothetical protein EP332_08980 [Bacteroidota bacterium]